jgi:hypothetical protein
MLNEMLELGEKENEKEEEKKKKFVHPSWWAKQRDILNYFWLCEERQNKVFNYFITCMDCSEELHETNKYYRHNIDTNVWKSVLNTQKLND